ncbi:cellulose synthase-like protein E6 [Bidens hawaiensis]|uniref:cellulose synthase-like protein E6 n=1 Tax=Bidens hawaiensis TaxID=980011 RepID=UPI004049D101
MVRDVDHCSLPLSETKPLKGRLVYQLYATSVLINICLILVYRFSHFPATGRWVWLIMSLSELWFGLYWILSQSVRWNPITRLTFKQRLTFLPAVDVFVCTADINIEPPVMVINTVLSVLAYDYPPEKLNVYLSDDDAGSELLFYALLEASAFARHWLPFCRKFEVKTTSPGACFSNNEEPNEVLDGIQFSHDWLLIKKLYNQMQDRIEAATRVGGVSPEIREMHKGFSEWSSDTTSSDHQAIVQILIDGKSSMSVDIEGQMLPKLVYVAREKRTHCSHNFKAGALNALIRVSSVISNSPIILTVDCDVYSNNSETVRDAMCCFMDEENGNKIAYVQFPQSSYNITTHDLYASCFRVPNELEMGGMDPNGGPCYIGSGCFHRRTALCGDKYSKIFKQEWNTENTINEQESTSVLQERCKPLASCTYEKDTQWGKEVGLKYGFPTEDFVTGLAIQCRGWKSAYLNPEKKAFVGIAPTTLLHILVQHKRWSEGQFSILVSKCCPFIYGHKRIPFTLQMAYTLYLLWAPNCLPTLAYVIIPQLCLLKNLTLFPRVSSLWILPFLYVIVTQYIYSLYEFVFCGGSVRGWWNEQRMWLFKRTTSYLLAFSDTLLGLLGLSDLGFTVTPKVVDEGVLERYKNHVMEFGSDSGMFTCLAFIAMINLLVLFWSLKTMVMDSGTKVLDHLALQVGLCVVVVGINLPVYEGLFVRKDEGKMPTSVTCNSVILALTVCMLVIYS